MTETFQCLINEFGEFHIGCGQHSVHSQVSTEEMEAFSISLTFRIAVHPQEVTHRQYKNLSPITRKSGKM